MKKVLLGLAILLTVSACSTKKESKINTMQPEEIVNVTRSETGGYSVKFLKEFNHELAFGQSENNINWDLKDGKAKGNSFSLACPYPQERYVLAVINTDENDTLYVSEKHIPMQGTPNFRDLGGIVNKDGRQLRWGAIFRSGALADLTPTDLEYFQTLKIGKVIDFRTPGEMEREPDRYPDSTVVSVHAMIGNPADVTPAAEGNDLSKITAEQAEGFMMKAYENFIVSLSDFQPIFDALQNDGPEKPFLFHCTAGKDRTGISAALILTTLNVDRDVILKDYLLSNTYNIPYYEKNKEKMTAYGFSDDVVKVMSSVKAEYIQSLFDAIDKQYGSADKMLEQVFGITPEKRKSIIEKYTIS